MIVVRVEVRDAARGSMQLLRVHSFDASVDFSVPANAPLLGRMNGRRIAYFNLMEKPEGHEIGDDATEDDWRRR